jgi:N-acylneuraminate cytidylyltransferase
MNLVVVITARGGSKRLPGKNLLQFGSSSLLGNTILFAQEFLSNYKIFVSTDNRKIAEEAIHLGSGVIERPDDLASDTATSVDVLKHSIWYLQRNEVACDAIILLQPTSPFRFGQEILEAIKLFQGSGRGSLFSVSVNKKKIFEISNGYCTNWLYEIGKRSQDLTSHYFENGNIYLSTKKSISDGFIITEDAIPFIQYSALSAVDIDTMEDYISATALINEFNRIKYE